MMTVRKYLVGALAEGHDPRSHSRVAELVSGALEGAKAPIEGGAGERFRTGKRGQRSKGEARHGCIWRPSVLDRLFSCIGGDGREDGSCTGVSRRTVRQRGNRRKFCYGTEGFFKPSHKHKPMQPTASPQSF